VILESAAVCLALNIFFEARGDTIEGQYAVALVTMNRVAEAKTGVCREVFRSAQFSWTAQCANSKHRVMSRCKVLLRGQSWEIAKDVASRVLAGTEDFTHGANYFYADYIPIPAYLVGAKFRGKFGRHYFYYKDTQHVN